MSTTAAARLGPIVVGVERTESSRDALALARTLARAVDTELILVAVYPVGARSTMMPSDAYTRTLEEKAESALEWVARPLAGVRASSRAVPYTSVARGLASVAKQERALAIVVGSSHRGPLGRIVLGSVGERLLRSAPCPVAVAPRGHWSSAAMGRIRRVGVGFAPTPEADEALSAALGIAARTGASIQALSVVEPGIDLTMTYALDYDKLEQTARDDLSASLARIGDEHGLHADVEGKVVDGYADDELARLSDEVDLVVCGSHSRGALGRVMLGSVSTGLVRKARCPVLIVPRGATDGFAPLQPPAEAAA
jgi:nucleotide-binding universal stress UspA family protein